MEFTIIHVMLSVAAWTIAYLVLHELAHALAALFLGYDVDFTLSSDGYILSPSVKVHGYVNGRDKLLILYSPYLINAVLVWHPSLAAKLIAILTLPNILLEDEKLRKNNIALTAYMLQAAIAIILLASIAFGYMLF